MLNTEAFSAEELTMLMRANSEIRLFDYALSCTLHDDPNRFNPKWLAQNPEYFAPPENTAQVILDEIEIASIEDLFRDGHIDEAKWKPFVPVLNNVGTNFFFGLLIAMGRPEIGLSDTEPVTLKSARLALNNAVGNANAQELSSRFSFKWAVESNLVSEARNYAIEQVVAERLPTPDIDTSKTDKIKKPGENIYLRSNGEVCFIERIGNRKMGGHLELLGATHAAKDEEKFAQATVTKLNSALAPVNWIDNQVREGIVCEAIPDVDGKYATGIIRVASTCESGGYVLIRKDGSVQKEGETAKLYGVGKAVHLNVDPAKRQKASVAGGKVPVGSYSHILFLSKEQYAKISKTQPNAGETDLEKINRILDRKKITALDIESYTQKLDELNEADNEPQQDARADDADESAEAPVFNARECARQMFELTPEDYAEVETLPRLNKILDLDNVTNEAELYLRATRRSDAPEFKPAWKEANPELVDDKDGKDSLASLFMCSRNQLGELLAEGSAPTEHQAVINDYLSTNEYHMSYNSIIKILTILGDPKAVESDTLNIAQITKALETAIGVDNAKKITERLSFQVFLQRYNSPLLVNSPESIASQTITRPFHEKRSVYHTIRIVNAILDNYGQVYGIADWSEPTNHRTFFVKGFETGQAGSLALTAALMQDGEDAVDLEKLYKDESKPLRLKAIAAFCDKNNKVAWLLNGKPVEGVIMQSHPHPTADGYENLYIYGVTDGARLVVVENAELLRFGKATEKILGDRNSLDRTYVPFKKTPGKQLAIIVDKNFDTSTITNIDFSNGDAIPEGVIAVVDLNKYYEALHPTPQAEPVQANPLLQLSESDDDDFDAPAAFPDDADDFPTAAEAQSALGSPPAPRAPRIDIDTPVPGPVAPAAAQEPLLQVRVAAAPHSPTPLHAVRMPAATRTEAGSSEPAAETAFFETSEADIKKRNTDRIVRDEDSDLLLPAELPRSGFGRKLALAGAILAGAGAGTYAGTYGYEKYDAGETDHVNLATGVVGDVDAIREPKLMRDTVFGLGSNETIETIPKSFEITVHDFKLDKQMVVQLTDVDFAPTTEGQKLDMEALKTKLLSHGLTRESKIFMQFVDSKTGQVFVSEENFKPGAKGDQRLTMRALNAGEKATVPRKVIPNTLFKIKFNQDGPEFVDNPMHYLPVTKAKLGETLAWSYKNVNLNNAGTKTDESGIASMRNVLLSDAINAIPKSKKVVGSTCEVEVPIVIFQTFSQSDYSKKVPPPTPPSQTK